MNSDNFNESGDNNNNYENINQEYHVKKKTRAKSAIIATAVCIIIVIAATVVIANSANSNLFKSDTEVALSAMAKSFSNYANLNEESNTLFSKVFGSAVIRDMMNGGSDNVSIKLCTTINECLELPEWIKGTGTEIEIKASKENKEENFNIKGTFNGLNFDFIKAYINEEYAVFESPIIDEKFFINCEDAPEEYYNIIKMSFEKNDGKSENLSEAGKQIGVILSKTAKDFLNEIGLKKTGDEKVGSYDCGVYSISINEDETKNFIKSCFANLLNDDNVTAALEEIMEQNGIKGIRFDNDAFIMQISQVIDYIDVYGADLIFYINGDDLIKMDLDFKNNESDGYACAFSFLGESIPSDNFEAEFYQYADNTYMNGFIITDKTTANGNNKNNTKTFAIKGTNEEELGNISINTTYNPSNMTFSGNITYNSDAVSGVAAEFSGVIESGNNFFNINFDEVSIKSFDGNDDEFINISTGLKISDSDEDIEVIDKTGAIDVINDYEAFENAIEKITNQLESYIGKNALGF